MTRSANSLNNSLNIMESGNYVVRHIQTCFWSRIPAALY